MSLALLFTAVLFAFIFALPNDPFVDFFCIAVTTASACSNSTLPVHNFNLMLFVIAEFW